MGISKYLKDVPLIDVARGLTRGATSEHKFGAVPAMSVNTTGTIWDVNDTAYPWSAFDTPGVLNIPAVDADDNGHIVKVFGLDENFDQIEEDFVISSTGTVTGQKTFGRVYRAYYYGALTNADDINIRRNTTVVSRISAGKAQTLNAIYTVPRKKTAYLMQGTASIQYGGDGTIDMFVRYFGQQSFRIGHSGEVAGTGMPYKYEFSVPLAVPQKTDIDVRVTVRSNKARVTAAFDMLILDNP